MTATDVSPTAAQIVAADIASFQLVLGGEGILPRQLVSDGFTSAQAYANDAYRAAQTLLGALQAAAEGLGDVPALDGNLIADLADAVGTLSVLVAQKPDFSPTLAFTDSTYSASELTHLISWLDSWVQGDFTGLPPAIEAAIWERNRTRELGAGQKKSQEALRQFAARGFSKPPGALAVQLLDAEQEVQDNLSTASRDIAIKQADLQQSNRRFAFEQAAKIQEALMQQLAQRMQRALDAGRTLTQYATEAFGVRMQGYGHDVSYATGHVSAEAQVIRAQTDVRIAEGNVRIESAKSNVQSLIQRATILVEAIRASAQISAQLAASALSAVNLSAGVSETASTSYSASDSRSRSISAAIGSQSNRQENYTP